MIRRFKSKELSRHSSTDVKKPTYDHIRGLSRNAEKYKIPNDHSDYYEKYGIPNDDSDCMVSKFEFGLNSIKELNHDVYSLKRLLQNTKGDIELRTNQCTNLERDLATIDTLLKKGIKVISIQKQKK